MLRTAATLLGFAMNAQSHPGALDADGCHHDTSTGRYHCHRDPKRNKVVARPPRNRAERLRRQVVA